jgi:hypothetical protein
MCLSTSEVARGHRLLWALYTCARTVSSLHQILPRRVLFSTAMQKLVDARIPEIYVVGSGP